MAAADRCQQYPLWNARGVDGVDEAGNVVAPARWPHLSSLAHVYAGMNTTSCQAERNFSAVKQVLSDMRAGTLPRRIEQMLLLGLTGTSSQISPCFFLAFASGTLFFFSLQLTLLV